MLITSINNDRNFKNLDQIEKDLKEIIAQKLSIDVRDLIFYAIEKTDKVWVRFMKNNNHFSAVLSIDKNMLKKYTDLNNKITLYYAQNTLFFFQYYH